MIIMKQNKYINPFTQVLLCEPAWNVMLQATGTEDKTEGDEQGQSGFGHAPRRVFI